MTQPNPPKLTKRKPQKFYWCAWFPYPISWLRTLILIPIAFPGARLIFLIFAGAILSAIRNSPALSIFSVVFGLLIPTIILSFPYHFFWFIWKKQPSLTYCPNWIPVSSSLWEAFYATFVIGFFCITNSYIHRIMVFKLQVLPGNSRGNKQMCWTCNWTCNWTCSKGNSGATDNIFDFNGSGVITRQQDNFAVKPWLVIWLIIAAYFYQVEYVIRQRFIPKLKFTIQNYQSGRKADKVDDADVELNRLHGEMGITQTRKGKAKPK